MALHGSAFFEEKLSMIFDPENGNKTRRKERKLWVTSPVWLQRVALHLAKGEHYCLSVSNFRCLFWIKSGAKRRPHWDRPKIPQKTHFREEPKFSEINVAWSFSKRRVQTRKTLRGRLLKLHATKENLLQPTR